jgi:tetratricopeptide (TPR) repeat protein
MPEQLRFGLASGTGWAMICGTGDLVVTRQQLGFIQRGVWLVVITAILLGAGAAPASAETNSLATAPSTTNAPSAVVPAAEPSPAVLAELATAQERLRLLEARLAEQQADAQRQRELAQLQASHQTTLVVVGALAALAFLGMLVFAGLLVWSVARRPAAATAAPVTLPVPYYPPGFGALPALASPAGSLSVANPAEEVSARFSQALGNLEQRLREMEAAVEARGAPPAATPAEQVAAETATPLLDLQRAALLGKGQSLYNLGEAEQALACFDQALALDPHHAEALVRKGMALEKLERLDEAIAQYDRAIALDHSLTLAWLQKGAAYTRLDRPAEALQCYEQALAAQGKGRGEQR